MKKTFSILTAVFAVIVFLVSCGGSEPGSIYGVVTGKATGELIKNAGVEVLPVGLKTVTGSDGYFEFLDISEGKYNFLVTKPGYIENKSSTITVKSGQRVPHNVTLEKAPAALQILIDGKEGSKLDFGAEIDDVSRQFDIFNNGEEKLNWIISYSADWIKEVRPEEGELKAFGTQGVIVTIDRSLLESGEQTTTINVTSNDGNKELTVKATNATVLPTLNTLEATSVDTDSAVLNGEILTPGVPEYTERGFVYSTSSLPTTDNTIEQLTAPLNDDAKYSSIARGLELGTTYYARAYAINEAGIAYSTNVVSFEPRQVPPELTTEHPTNISFGSGTATFNGTIVSIGDPAYTERGFVYGHDHNPTVEDDNKKEVTGNGEGAFSIKVTELEINTIYYVRAYAINEAGIGYGNEIMLDFNAVKPIVYTKEVTNVSISGGTATFNGSIESVGDPVYTERGFVYGHAHNPTVEDDIKKEVAGYGEGAFSIKVTELEINTIYYIRAYAINEAGIGYGNEVVLDFNAVKPIIYTKEPTNISISGGTATFNGSIESVGDPEYIERGFVYGTVHNPTVENADTDTGDTDTLPECSSTSGTPCKDSSSSLVWSAKASTTYTWQNAVDYCNSYSEGGYSDWKLPNIDELRTLLIASRVSANCQASETNGCLSSSCWTCSTCTESCTPASSGTDCDSCQPYSDGRFSKLGDGNVYLWSSSTRSDDTGRAWYVSFPSGNVNNYYKTSSNYVRCVRYSQSDTGSADTDIADRKKVVPGSGTGAFSASVTNLEMNKTYYIRTYATNLQGTAYGSEVTLDFNPIPASVKTNAVLNVDTTKATLSGTINSIGDPAYTEKGFVYSKNPNPTTLNNKVAVSGSGSGTFTWNLTELETRITYYVKAYVISNNNVIYGNEVSFYTESPYYYVIAGSLIVAKEDAGKGPWDSAVDMCENSNLAGFTDWRLPTKSELLIAYNNKDLIGGFKDDRWYWSSTSSGSLSAYYVNFSNGHVGYNDKSGSIYVRCVR